MITASNIFLIAPTITFIITTTPNIKIKCLFVIWACVNKGHTNTFLGVVNSKSSIVAVLLLNSFFICQSYTVFRGKSVFYHMPLNELLFLSEPLVHRCFLKHLLNPVFEDSFLFRCLAMKLEGQETTFNY